MNIPKAFVEWASSMSGCDGGNPSSDYWFCGIEWGGASEDNGKYYTDLVAEIAKGEVTNPSLTYNWAESLTYTYGRNVAKLFAVLNGKKIDDYNSYVKELLGSEIFRLNLFPVAFDNTDPALWKANGLDKITGFEEKQLFQYWCLPKRARYFQKIIAENNPKLVVGTGISYLRDFLMFFCNNNDDAVVNKIEIGSTRSDGTPIKRAIYWTKLDGGTILAVIPFFSGSHGLNSNDLLQKAAEAIDSLITAP